MVRRIFVEKKKGFDVEAQSLCADIRENLGIKGLTGVRVLNRYDMDGLSDELYRKSVLMFSQNLPSILSQKKRICRMRLSYSLRSIFRVSTISVRIRLRSVSSLSAWDRSLRSSFPE